MSVNLILCSNFYPPFFVGGAEVIAHEQARYLTRLGVQVTVFCGRHDESKPRYSLERDRHDGIQVVRVVLHAQDYQLGQNFHKPEVDARFEALLAKVKPDVVHFHNLVGLSLGLIPIANRRGIRTIMTFHDHWGFCSKNTLLKSGDQVCQDFSACADCQPELWETEQSRIHIRMRNDYLARCLSKIDCFISPSAYLASAYAKAGLPEQRLRIISYGIDFERFSKIKPSNEVLTSPLIRFTFIGHLGFHKGVHVLISALRKLHHEGLLGETLCMNIVGVGEMDEELRQFVEGEGLETGIRLWGRIDHRQIDQVYANTDVLITSSIWPENEPVTILEAMSVGIPVLASDLGGNLNLIDPGRNGELAEVGNADSLAEKMCFLADNPGLICQMGQNAQARMAQDTFSTYAERILEVYKSSVPVAPPGDRRIVLCSAGLSVIASQTLSYVGGSLLHETVDILSETWLQEKDWEDVVLFWITDAHYSEHLTQHLLQRGIPLLVPSQNLALVALCREACCGLFYEDEFEAWACLDHLLSDHSLLMQLGQNARTHATQQKVFSWPWSKRLKTAVEQL